MIVQTIKILIIDRITYKFLVSNNKRFNGASDLFKHIFVLRFSFNFPSNNSWPINASTSQRFKGETCNSTVMENGFKIFATCE